MSRADEAYYESPHRGTLILWLGVGSIIFTNCCPFVGLGVGGAAWVLGNGDLERMAAREMDPSGYENTRTGKICGIVGFAIGAIYAGAWLFIGLVQFLRV